MGLKHHTAISYRLFLILHTRVFLKIKPFITESIGWKPELVSWQGKVECDHRFRYRDNGLLVDQKETETNFNPSFTDLQTFISYAQSDQLFFNVLGAFSANPIDMSHWYDKPTSVHRTTKGTCGIL